MTTMMIKTMKGRISIRYRAHKEMKILTITMTMMNSSIARIKTIETSIETKIIKTVMMLLNMTFK